MRAAAGGSDGDGGRRLSAVQRLCLTAAMPRRGHDGGDCCNLLDVSVTGPDAVQAEVDDCVESGEGDFEMESRDGVRDQSTPDGIMAELEPLFLSRDCPSDFIQ